MRKSYILGIFLLLLFTVNVSAKTKYYYIGVEEIKSKEKPSFWGRRKDSFFYGDKVEALEWKGSWVNIYSGNSGKKGWVKDTVITSKKIVGNNKMNVDADELALAGKGFTSELEAEYSNIYDKDFSIVDKIEKVKIPDDEIMDFIIEGKLEGEE